MKPNYETAVMKAQETLLRFGIDTFPVNPLQILLSLPNVRAYCLDISPPGNDSWDAMSCVRNKDGCLQYLVMYNRHLPSFMVNNALARELAHVVLEHDGNSPEEIWTEEAVCFAYHFLYPLSLIQKKNRQVYYRPIRDNFHWEMKEITSFRNLEALKEHIVSEQNLFNKFVGRPVQYSASDVELINQNDTDCLTGWRNCYDVVLDGRTVGYCGE